MESRWITTMALLAAVAGASPSRCFAEEPAGDATTQPQVQIYRGGGGFGGAGGFAGGGGGGGFGGGAATITGDGEVARVGGMMATSDGHGNVATFRIVPVERAGIITTEAMDGQTQANWKEDLNIMQKLLRDHVRGATGDTSPAAMGIRLTMIGDISPVYIDGYGAIFGATVNLPLASGEVKADKPDEKGATTTSAWDRARSELDGNQNLPAPRRQLNSFFSPASAKFDQAKLDELMDGVIKVLPEASHMRGLKPDEFVIVTISGTDDSGHPKRITFKAKKSDIDDASSGKIKPEEFAQRIAHRIG